MELFRDLDFRDFRDSDLDFPEEGTGCERRGARGQPVLRAPFYCRDWCWADNWKTEQRERRARNVFLNDPPGIKETGC